MSAVDDAMPSTAPSSGDFAYPDFYRAMLDREHLQVSRDEVTWTEKAGEPGSSVDVLLNFGCNVRQTPHLMREAVAVLETLEVNFAAVAGQHYCCGKPYSNNGLRDAARRVVEASVRRMASYQPERAIQWCSACEMQFSDIVIPDIGISFRSEGLAAFLIGRLDELGDSVAWQNDVTTRVLVHGHFGEHQVRDAHPPVTVELLGRIPGVEVLGIADDPSLNLCDNAGPKIATIGTEAYLTAQGELERYLREAGADTMVTLYHGCTRELGKFASDHLRIRHYVSIIAEALGVSKPDRFSELWRLGDPEKVVEASRPNWQTWDIDEQEARRLAHKYFVPSYAVNAPECPCNGECTRTGAKWLTPHEIEGSGPLIAPEDLI